jgi:Fe-S cluster biogenesis protein NfuA/nitrite reductase/ring-hydroxylating ferredoxin subunit
MPEASNAREVGARIEALLGDLDRVADARTRAKTEELIALVVELYGSGIERIIELAHQGGSVGEQLISRMTDDELVESLLILHGLHPVDVETRVHNALEKVRPYLGSHAGGVDFLGVDEHGVAHLRLEGSCDGCPSSTVTVRTAIEGAIAEAAPEVTAVEVEGMSETGSPRPSLIHIEPLAQRTGESPEVAMSKWTQLPDSVVPAAGQTTVLERDGVWFLLCSAAGELYAYRNLCAACASPLERAVVAGTTLTCADCHHRYDIRLAGRSLDDAQLHLEPLPLIRDDGNLMVSLVSGVLH